jgi:protocatechuate 3,4-dioxygenase, alpha subunit
MTSPPELPAGLEPTPSQTAGPFFHIGFEHLCRATVIAPGDDGASVTVRGRVIDGDGAPVPDAAIEIWQANSNGAYAAGSHGFGRVCTDDEGCFSFATVRPGVVVGSNGEPQAPHLVVVLLMRGLLKPLKTRMYFADDHRNATDPVLSCCVPRDRRDTLVARVESPGVVSWTIVLQGLNETVFFEW